MRDLRARCESVALRLYGGKDREELFVSEQARVHRMADAIESFARSLIEECARVAEEGIIPMRPEDFDQEYIVAINRARNAIAAAILRVGQQP